MITDSLLLPHPQTHNYLGFPCSGEHPTESYDRDVLWLVLHSNCWRSVISLQNLKMHTVNSKRLPSKSIVYP